MHAPAPGPVARHAGAHRVVVSTPGADDRNRPAPLLVTADDARLEAMLRLAAAAGVTPEVTGDPGAARRAWTSAPAVLVADDAAPRLAGAAPPRRPGVLVVCPDVPRLEDWRAAVALGAEDVVALPSAERRVVGLLCDAVDDARQASCTVAVVGACGGAGASTLAAALGVAADARGLQALVLDGDPLGGGIDLVLGAEDFPGLRWPDLSGTAGRVGAAALRESLPRVGGLSVLSWDRGEAADVPADVVREVVSAARRGHDVVVADVSRHVDPAGAEVLAHADATLLLVPGDVRSVASARRVAEHLSAVTAAVALVVRRMPHAGLDADLVEEGLGLPVVAEMRAERGLSAALDAGDGLWRRRRGPLARACRTILEAALPAGPGSDGGRR